MKNFLKNLLYFMFTPTFPFPTIIDSTIFDQDSMFSFYISLIYDSDPF